MSRVLLVNHEHVGPRMSGPTIRNWELARVLAETNAVTLAAPGQPTLSSGQFAVVSMDGDGLAALVAANDVVVISGYLLDKHPVLREARYLVVDLNGPFTLENLHMHQDAAMADRQRIAAADREVLSRLIRAGDVFLCSGERQRDFWTGWLAAAGRVNPILHAADPGLNRLFLVVPFGLPEEPPQGGARRFRGALPGIAEDDFIVIWSSGIWNWFDPLTLIEAVAATESQLPSLRVVFPVPSSPSLEVGPMRMAADARALSDRLGLTGRRVFFGTSMAYEERGSILLEADVATSLHLDDVETRYSFRTRMLDWFWAGLPILTTEGDVLSEVVRGEELGEVVPYGDVAAVCSALVRLEGDRTLLAEQGRRSRTVAERFRWSAVARPLVDYCRAPYSAADREAIRAEDRAAPPPETKSRHLARVFAATLREEGPAGLARKGAAYIRRITRRRP